MIVVYNSGYGNLVNNGVMVDVVVFISVRKPSFHGNRVTHSISY